MACAGMSINYLPPRPDQLQALKRRLGYTGRVMAGLSCVSPQHWRRYTGGSDPKHMPYSNLFHLAAQLTLEPSQIERVHQAMREIGAYVFNDEKIVPSMKEETTA